MLRLRLATLLFGLFLFQGAFAATFYYNNEVDYSWGTLGNWWMDSGHTIHAVSLPSSTDDVIVQEGTEGNSTYINDGPTPAPTVHNITIEGGLTNPTSFNIDLIVTGTATLNNAFQQLGGTINTQNIILNGDSSAGVYGTLIATNATVNDTSDLGGSSTVGTAYFYGHSRNDSYNIDTSFFHDYSVSGVVSGSTTFYDHSSNEAGIISAGSNVIFNDYSVNGNSDPGSMGSATIVFNDYSVNLTPFSFEPTIDFYDNSKNGDIDHMWHISAPSYNVTFHDQSENFQYFEGNARFYDASINHNTIAGDAYYACGAGGGAVLGTVTFGSCPTPTSAPDLVTEKDTGISTTDNYTKENLPIFSGECEEGALVHVNIDGTTVSPTDICENGQYSITLSSALSAGTHDIKVLFSNPEGLSYGTSGLSPALSVNIDTNYPVTSDLDSTISKTSAALSFSTEELTTSTVSYGTTSSYGTDVTVSASLQNNHSVVISGLNTCNRYHYRIQTTDKAGNVSTTSDATFLTTCGGVSNALPTVDTSSVQNTPTVVPQNTPTPSIEKPLENTPANPTHPNETEFTTPATTSSSTPSVPIVEPEKKEVFIATILTPRRYEYGNVSLLQSFFNEYQGEHLQITGEYDEETIEAVNRFQLLYKDEILKPWGLTRPTGNVGPRTLAKINSIVNPNIRNQ